MLPLEIFEIHDELKWGPIPMNIAAGSRQQQRMMTYFSEPLRHTPILIPPTTNKISIELTLFY